MKEEVLMVRMDVSEKEHFRMLSDAHSMTMSDMAKMLFKLGNIKLNELVFEAQRSGLTKKELASISVN